MITKFNIFENKIDEGLIISAPTKKVIKILKKKFPDYYIGLVSAGEQSEIEISAGRKENITNVEEIENICNVLGWFISHGNSGGEWTIKYDKNFKERVFDDIVIMPKFDPKNIGGKPSFMYHVTRKKILPKIFKIGLIPKHKDRQVYHPDRVYLTDSLELAWGLKKEFERVDKDEYEILKISTKGLNVKLYSDVDARQNGFYTLENIPPTFISILPESEYKKHWSWKEE